MPLEPRVLLDGVTYRPAAETAELAVRGVYDDLTLGQAFRAAAAAHPERAAIATIAECMTYRELDEASDRLGAGFLGLGLVPLDRMVLQLANVPDLIVTVIACWKAGLIPVCTLAAHREQEIGYLSALSEARAHVVHFDDPKFDFLEFARHMQRVAPTLSHIVGVGGGKGPKGLDTVESLSAKHSASTARRRLETLDGDPRQVAVFQLSGGTTGVPKIIPRFHDEYLYNMREVAAFLDFRCDDTLFFPMPMAHNANMVCGWGPTLLSGGCVAVEPRVDSDSIAAIVRATKPTWLASAKVTLLRLLAANKAFDLSGVRGIISTDSAALVRRQLGVPGFHIFGMTEGTIMFTRDGDADEILDTSVGRPISTLDEIRLLVPGTELDVALGETGELAVRGPYTFRGYYRAPDRNAEVFTRDGYYRSGDLMSARQIDGQTYYVFEGRLKDVIDRGNEKINCEEVERQVRFHPAVADVAIVAMPDEAYGERACAFIIAAADDAPSVSELGSFLEAQGLARFKWPERIEAIDAFPMTKSGKLDKSALRVRIRAILAGEQPPIAERSMS